MRLVSRDVPHIFGAINNILHPPHVHTLPSHGHMFTVHVSAVIDNDWDPGITEVTCLQRRVAQAWQKKAPWGPWKDGMPGTALREGKWGAEGSGWQPPWAVGCRGSPAPWG